MGIVKTLSELIHPESRPDRICESCKNPFHCGASLKGCWCLKVELREGARKELRSTFKDCLCPECLERFSVREGNPE